MRKAIWLVLALTAALPACVTAPENDLATLEQELADKQRESTRVFSAPRDEVLRAAQTVLNAMSDDFEFSLSSDGMAATRGYLIYAVLAATWGRDYWAFRTEAVEGGTRLTIAARGDINMGLFGSSIPPTFHSDIPIEARDGISPAEARLFLDRVEYVLGRRSDWRTCSEISRRDLAYASAPTVAIMCNGAGISNDPPAR